MPLRAYTGARANAVVSVLHQLIVAVTGGYRYILLLTGDPSSEELSKCNIMVYGI